jgi:hypothetical protein
VSLVVRSIGHTTGTLTTPAKSLNLMAGRGSTDPVAMDRADKGVSLARWGAGVDAQGVIRCIYRVWRPRI